MVRFQLLPLEALAESLTNPRRRFDDTAMAELTESLRTQGVLQPILVRPIKERPAEAVAEYEIVAGHRRVRAARAAGVLEVPAMIRDLSDLDVLEMQLVENLQRADLNPLEEAHGYASLIRDFDLTQDAAAQRVGKGRATVANSLRLLGLEPELQGYVGKGLLSVGHAKVLLGVEHSPERLLLARRALEQGLSVRALEELLRHKSGGPGKKRRMPGATATALGDIEKRLTSHLGARTTLKHSPKRGRIIIEYQGNEDLARVLEKMGVTL